MRQSRTLPDNPSTPTDTLKHLLDQRRQGGSAELDSALWLATIDWLAARARQRVAPPGSPAQNGSRSGDATTRKGS
jgi:hypothetical protein